MQFLKNPSFDFMSRRNLFLGLSAILVVGSIAVLATKGVDRGIEFTGGTELQLKFSSTPDVGAIRTALNEAGMTKQVVTTIDDPSLNEIIIKLGSSTTEEATQDPIAPVIAALREKMGALDPQGRPDINIVDESSLRSVLANAPSLSTRDAEALAQAIVQKRKEKSIFGSHDELLAIEGATPEVVEYLGEQTAVGPMALRSQSYIGPAVGRELARKALIAIVLSIVLMLVYIGFRFQLQWGFAAVMALTHDTLLTLGLFSLFNQEMTLPVVAAFLTLVGYSVNDTVVVFDRIRENLRLKQGESLPKVINVSINQTLARTIITSGLTWIVVAGLYFFGGQALKPFSFVLTVGVLVGTYSSIYVASPLLVLWKQYVDRRGGQASAGSAVASGAGTAKKVRT